MDVTCFEFILLHLQVLPGNRRRSEKEALVQVCLTFLIILCFILFYFAK